MNLELQQETAKAFNSSVYSPLTQTGLSKVEGTKQSKLYAPGRFRYAKISFDMDRHKTYT